jgi:hypothetical protein
VWRRRRYPSDLTDAHWALIQPLLLKPGTGGRPKKQPRRRVNAILYLVRSGHRGAGALVALVSSCTSAWAAPRMRSWIRAAVRPGVEPGSSSEVHTRSPRGAMPLTSPPRYSALGRPYRRRLRRIMAKSVLPQRCGKYAVHLAAWRCSLSTPGLPTLLRAGDAPGRDGRAPGPVMSGVMPLLGIFGPLAELWATH